VLADYILETENLVYHYQDGTQALKGASIKIPRGKKTALLGSNGAGKSTLFLHFNGILRPQGGTVKYDGQEVRYDRKTLMELRKNVGIVFQDPDSQLFSASVYQEISFGPLNLGLPVETVRERVEQAMDVTGIKGLKDKPTHMLSYGQKKMVSIADILAMQPQVLICDEPTAWLDPEHAGQLVKLFDRINRDGTTIVLSTHDVDMAYSWADYIFVMSDGRIIGEGEPGEIFGNEILIRNACLEIPWLVEAGNLLIRKGCLPAKTPLPRSKEDFFKLMLNHRMCAGGEEGLNDCSAFRNAGRERNSIAVNLKRI